MEKKKNIMKGVASVHQEEAVVDPELKLSSSFWAILFVITHVCEIIMIGYDGI